MSDEGYLAPKWQRTRPTGIARSLIPISAALVLLFVFGGRPLGLVAALAVATLLLAWGLARANLSALEVLPPAASLAAAGAWFELAIRVRNRSSWFVARDLLLTLDDGTQRTTGPTGYLPSLARGESSAVRTAPRFATRGRRHALRLTITSSFPFQLFERTLVFELPADILVLPYLAGLRALDDRVAHFAGRRLDTAQGTVGDGEFYGLREWREGESLRGVHWKLSARRGRLLVRELRNEDRPAVHLYLSTLVAGPFLARAGNRHPSFERAVCLTATIAEHFLRGGHRVALTVVGPNPCSIERGRGRASLYPILATLAEVEPDGGDPLAAVPQLRQGRRRRDGRDEVPIVVVAGRGAQVPRSEAIHLDVDAADIDEVFDPAQTRHAPLFTAPSSTWTG